MTRRTLAGSGARTQGDLAVTAATERAYLVLRAAVIQRRFLPGDLVPRSSIAAELAISQTPLREALSRLADERFVEVLPRSSTRVLPIDVLELHEGHFLKVALAAEAVRRLAARPAAAEGLGDLEIAALLPAMFECVGMRRLWERLMPYFGALDRCRALDPLAASSAEASLRADLLGRIAAGDATGATATMRSLLMDELAPLSTWQARHPEMFA